MNRFLFHTSFFLGVLLALCIVCFYVADSLGATDHVYKKITEENSESSLIIGTSRAAQAIQPSIINRLLATTYYSLPIYNFAFTITDSPFGEVYYQAIKNKIRKYQEKHSPGLFIVAVDPFSLSHIIELDNDQPRDEKGYLNHIHHYYKPNFNYLFRYFKPIEWHKTIEYQKLHDDGWLEISPYFDSLSFQKNRAKRIDLYRNYSVTPSQDRVFWLKQTIQFLLEYGDVYLCRISTCNEMNQIETMAWPSFDEEMQSIAQEYSIHYFSFFNDWDKYRTTDGNHIFKEDGKLFTKALCDSITTCMASRFTKGK